MMEAEVFDRAVAFHYRRLERAGLIPWQPDRGSSDAWVELGIVVLRNVNGAAAYSFHETEAGSVRFRSLPEIEDEQAHRRLLKRAARAISTPEKAAPLLLGLGLSTREVGALLGLSHEAARRKAGAQ